jgi:inorganic pyrophosphatase
MSNPYERIEELLGSMFQAHPWHGLPARTEKHNVYNAFVELVPTDTVKYETDKATGHLRLDRPQRLSSMCPMPYGLIPQTYCGHSVAARYTARTGEPDVEGDGDPMDICVLTEKSTAHGNFLAHVRPIGGLRMLDGNQVDDKIIAVLDQDVAFDHLENISDCPAGIVERLKHYFLSYKKQPDKHEHLVKIAEVYDRDEAFNVIACSIIDYHDQFGTREERIRALRRYLRIDD